MASATKSKDAEQTQEERIADATKRVMAAKRLKRITDARDDLLDFTCFTMPSPLEPDDPELSRYDPQKHHRVLAAALEQVLAGEILRLIVVMPPRHGKSELTSRRFPAWVLGKEPSWEIVQATYNEEFAMDFGRDVRGIIQLPHYKQIFPGTVLKKGEAAADRIKTTEGGGAYYVGRGGSITGRGGDLLIGDDLLKDRKEADSKTIREDLWKWYNDVFLTRMKDEGARIILIMTRWHEDDLIGRLTDPTNPCYDAEEAAKWHILDLPALALVNDPMGRAVGEPLWPGKFSAPFFQSIKRISPRTFSALYQGRPTPEEGNFFKAQDIRTYMLHELPPKERLRFYAGSDHAVSMKQDGDLNCLAPVGVDANDNIWVLPDVYWQQSPSDLTVEAMIDLMEAHKFLFWWAEDDHIRKSIGPFLRKRMEERKVYCTVSPVRPSKDKMTRAQPIKGRMSMGKVLFPKFAPWWADAKDQLLKFPDSRHDDFVDALGHIGNQLGLISKGQAPGESRPEEPASGTFAWIKWAAKKKATGDRRRLRGGW